MKDEIWLQKLKERLDDYTEPTPDSGWKRIEKDLPAPKQAHHFMPIRRWITTIAAAILIGIMVVIGVRLTQYPHLHTLPIANSTQEATSADALPTSTSPSRPIPSTPDAVIPPHALAMQNTEIKSVDNKIRENENRNNISLPPSLHHQTNKENDPDKIQSNDEKESENFIAKKKTTLPSTNEHLLAKADAPRPKGWAFGLSVGNAGGFSHALNNTGIQSLMQQEAPGTGYMNIDLTAASNGIIAIPENQEIVFKNGIPYLQYNHRQILSADHKQPVSIGFSLRKNLPHKLSVETGLVYTFLASDLYYLGDSQKTRQKLHYLGIPIRANWNFLNRKNFTLYISAGGMVEKCIYGKIGSETEIVDPVQLSVMASAGIQYNINSKIGIYVEPGIAYYFDDGSDIQTIRKENPHNFTLQAGLRLSY